MPKEKETRKRTIESTDSPSDSPAKKMKRVDLADDDEDDLILCQETDTRKLVVQIYHFRANFNEEIYIKNFSLKVDRKSLFNDSQSFPVLL